MKEAVGRLVERLAGEVEAAIRIPYSDLPGFPARSSPGISPERRC
jgi:hypothetical protein